MVVKGLYCWIIFISLLLINGCSHTNVSDPSMTKPGVTPSVKQSFWKKRQVFLSAKQGWNLRSKISLRHADENWIFGLQWAQRPANKYVMQITNPITGALVAKLSRDNRGVSLLADNGRIYRDNDEERLLQSQSGVRLPVKGMQHWVRGLTSPQYKVDKLVLDNIGRPQSIYQAGWKINFSNYLNNSFNAMPRKITLTRSKDKVYLKVIAKQWQGI